MPETVLDSNNEADSEKPGMSQVLWPVDSPTAGTPGGSAVDWAARQDNPVRRVLNAAERISLVLESPVEWFVRRPWFNPLYQTGTITNFLLVVILLTGLYLTFFYQFGFTDSYVAVERIEANFIGRLMRSLHRYASGAAVITTLLHGWRTFFQDRFRGPRWLAWVTGVVMAIFLWAIGATGYWLIWDERAVLLNQSLIALLEKSSLGRYFLVNYLVSSRAGAGWLFLLLVLTVHLGLSALLGWLLWYHLKRLSRPKLIPPEHWSWAVGSLLVLLSLALPAGMLAQANPDVLPGKLPIDLFFLGYLPAALSSSPLVFWGGAALLAVLLAALPWILVRRPLPPLKVDAARCTGCTLCAADCPYHALQMVERTDGRPHHFVAVLDPGLCVSCGVCIGTCPDFALSFGDRPAEALWQATLAQVSLASRPVRVVFTCERHAYQRGRCSPDEQGVRVIPLTCAGMLHPDLIGEALKAGAAQVQVIGCPPEDCANREGNLFLQQRLERKRLPRLRRSFEKAAIFTDWLSPRRFMDALRAGLHQSQADSYAVRPGAAGLRQFAPGLLLLAGLLAGQAALTRVPLQSLPGSQAQVEIIMNHRSGFPLVGFELTGASQPDVSQATRLLLHVDGKPVFDRSFQPGGKGLERYASIYARLNLVPGEHRLQLAILDRPGQSDPQVLYDQVANVQVGQVLRLEFTDTHTGSDPLEGQKLYYETSLGTNAGCRICHALEPGVVLVGPSFAGVATRAASRVPGLSAEEYLRQSILDPDVYVVSGFPAGQMVPGLGKTLTEQQIDDLVAFLMTLK